MVQSELTADDEPGDVHVAGVVNNGLIRCRKLVRGGIVPGEVVDLRVRDVDRVRLCRRTIDEAGQGQRSHLDLAPHGSLLSGSFRASERTKCVGGG